MFSSGHSGKLHWPRMFLLNLRITPEKWRKKENPGLYILFPYEILTSISFLEYITRLNLTMLVFQFQIKFFSGLKIATFGCRRGLLVVLISAFVQIDLTNTSLVFFISNFIKLGMIDNLPHSRKF